MPHRHSTDADYRAALASEPQPASCPDACSCSPIALKDGNWPLRPQRLRVPAGANRHPSKPSSLRVVKPGSCGLLARPAFLRTITPCPMMSSPLRNLAGKSHVVADAPRLNLHSRKPPDWQPRFRDLCRFGDRRLSSEPEGGVGWLRHFDFQGSRPLPAFPRHPLPAPSAGATRRTDIKPTLSCVRLPRRVFGTWDRSRW